MALLIGSVNFRERQLPVSASLFAGGGDTYMTETSVARAQDAQGTPTQSHTPPSILICEENSKLHDSHLGRGRRGGGGQRASPAIPAVAFEDCGGDSTRGDGGTRAWPEQVWGLEV